MSGMNLFEGLNWLVDDVARRLYYNSTRDTTKTEANKASESHRETKEVC